MLEIVDLTPDELREVEEAEKQSQQALEQQAQQPQAPEAPVPQLPEGIGPTAEEGALQASIQQNLQQLGQA
jgi:hypothetical protein